MVTGDFITIQGACKLLGVSRPTFNKYRKKYELKSTEIHGRLRFSKLELIEKIIYSRPVLDNKEIRLNAIVDLDFSSIILGANVFDLRKNIILDAFATISFLCTLKDIVRNQSQSIYILVEDNNICRYLKSIGFFRELERSNAGVVLYRKNIITDDPGANSTVILPLHLIGYKGADKKIIEVLYDVLLRQGFSEELSSYLGWVMGELTDNSMTHSGGAPCYLMVTSRHSEEIEFKFLSFVIGDIGCGIPRSLKSNVKYAALNDKKAFASAFLSNVSSWDDEHGRGKGLNDILTIGIGNRAWVRAESNNLSFFANFLERENNINWINPVTSSDGTRIALILIDNEFNKVSREEVNKIMNNFIGN